MNIKNFTPMLQLMLICGLTASPASMQAQLRPGDHVAIIGDSITQQKKYSVFIEDYLVMCQPQPGLQVTQFGWSGETSDGFRRRFQNDVLPFQPDVVTTCYGMNDGRYRAVSEQTLEFYRQHTTDYVQQMKEAGIRWIVVGSPGMVDTVAYNRPNADAETYNHTLKELGRVGQEVAEAEGVSFVDVHTPMMRGVELATDKYGEGYVIAKDGVHPGDNGQLLMAYAFLKALGCDGDIGRIEYDFASNTHQSDDAQTIVSAVDGMIEVTSVRYPFCYEKDTDDVTEIRDMAQAVGFDNLLNRYMLVVKNAPAQAKVTWGDESREYTSEELAQGVNLAADFIGNPFQKPFFEVQRMIYRKQAFETHAVKEMLHAVIGMERYIPGSQEEFADVTEKVVRKDAELRQAITAAVTPVTHTIKIEPASEFAPKTYTNAEGETLKYRIYTPNEMEAGEAYPLILFFHGAGERGKDNERQLVHGVKEMVAFSKEQNRPVIIIAPQCPGNGQWVNTPWGDPAHSMPVEPSDPMRLAIELLDESIEILPVDEDRIYVTGLSMGGFGAWDIVQRMPETFAAAMPVCGGGDTAMAPVIKDVPLWVFHGGKDTVVLTSRSQDMVAALEEVGGNVRYTEYERVGHNAWDYAYRDEEAFTWLLDQKISERE